MVTTMRDKEVFLLAPGDHSNNPGESHPFGQGSILVVEDDAPTLRLERVLLEEEGYSVDVVASGEEAVEAISAKNPTLVLLDIGLPGMDGFTTCQRIREISRVPIIMVTGRDCLDDKVKGMNVGADDYVTKPFLTHELATRVKVLLRRANLENGAAHNSNGPDQVQPQVSGPAPQQSTNGVASHQHPEKIDKADSPTPANFSDDSQTAEMDSPSAELPGPASPQATDSSLEGSQDEEKDSPSADLLGPTSAAPSTEHPQCAELDSSPADLPEVALPQAPAPSPAVTDDEAVYEGNVRLTVTTLGPVSHLINFVSDLRQNPQFRLLRLVANQHKEGMDIWLGLREPLSLKTALLGMKGVSEVSVTPVTSSESEEPVFKVILQ